MVVSYNKNKNWNYNQQKQWDINFSCYINAARDNLFQVAKHTSIKPLLQCPIPISSCKNIYDFHLQINTHNQRRIFLRYLDSEINLFRNKPIIVRLICQFFNIDQINSKKNLRIFFHSFNKLNNLEYEFQQTLGDDYPSHPINSYKKARSLLKCQTHNSIIEQAFTLRHQKLQKQFEEQRKHLKLANDKARDKLTALNLRELTFQQYEEKVHRIKFEFSEYYESLIHIRPGHDWQKALPTSIPQEEQLFYQKALRDDYSNALLRLADVIKQTDAEFDLVLQDQLKHDKCVVERFIKEKTKLLQDNCHPKRINKVMQDLHQQLEQFQEVLSKVYEDSKYEDDFIHFLKTQRITVNEKTLQQTLASHYKEQEDKEYMNIVSVVREPHPETQCFAA